MEFEWDPRKANQNFRKHRVSFVEASTVLGDTLGITIHDPVHSDVEERHLTIGRSSHGRLLLVAHTDRDDRIRIISFRELTRPEREAYEETLYR